VLVFLVGVLGTLWFTRTTKVDSSETQMIYNGLEQIAKLQVTEGYFTEVHTFKDAKSYWNDLISFDKKALVVVNAKAQISYDLSQLNILVDSIQKQIVLKNIPTPEVTIVPDITYYDIQQSSLNAFSAKDYNTIKDKVLRDLKKNVIVSDLKAQAHHRLFEELSKLLVVSKIYKWAVVDKTKNEQIKAILD
jgi:hypothetical protein